MQFFKSRFFIVALIVALILVIVPTVLSVMGLSSYVRAALGTIVSPFQRAAAYVADGIGGFTEYFTEFDRLKEENAELKKELADLTDKIYSAELTNEENDWLRSYIGIKREHIDFELESATVIARESGNYMTVFVLNRGTLHGVGVNMPIITEEGVVGYVCETGPTWSKGVTLIETASAVGAYVERSGETGVVEGTYMLKADGLCTMSYLPPDADIKEGDRVLTSGVGSVYPQGLLIGTVESVGFDENTRETTAKISLAAVSSDVKKVMIIKDFKITTGD